MAFMKKFSHFHNIVITELIAPPVIEDFVSSSALAALHVQLLLHLHSSPSSSLTPSTPPPPSTSHHYPSAMAPAIENVSNTLDPNAPRGQHSDIPRDGTGEFAENSRHFAVMETNVL